MGRLQRRRPDPIRRRGFSLLELVVSVSLLALTLVPALAFLRDALEQSQRIEISELLTTHCVGKLEEHLCLAADAWQVATVSGDFSADGYPQVRYRVVRSDAPADGGITDQLMAVTSTVWQDLNSNGSADGGEPTVVLAGKVAKMARYP
jgi:prepilin-type N-terminal cleavage/methylation domain-containing protein